MNRRVGWLQGNRRQWLPRTQLITLAVDTWRRRGDAAAVQLGLLAIRGVEAVAPDPVCPRLWVFADGALEPDALVDALESRGYGAYVLENEFTMPA